MLKSRRHGAASVSMASNQRGAEVRADGRCESWSRALSLQVQLIDGLIWDDLPRRHIFGDNRWDTVYPTAVAARRE